SRVIIAERQKTQGDWNCDETVNLLPPARAVLRVAYRRVFMDQVNENGGQQDDLRAIAECQSEAGAGESRAVIDQNEIERAECPHDRESQRDLPRAGESKIRPHPGPEDREKRQRQSPLDVAAVSRREQIEEQGSRSGEQRGKESSGERFNDAKALERG